MNKNTEPTVLDFVKALLTPWRGSIPEIPPLESEDIFQTNEDIENFSSLTEKEVTQEGLKPLWDIIRNLGLNNLPWYALTGLGLALIAQFLLEPEFRHADSFWGQMAAGLPFVPADYRYLFIPICLYIFSGILFLIAVLGQEWHSAQPEAEVVTPFSLRGNWLFLILAAPILMAITFLAFRLTGGENLRSNEFNALNLAVWIYTFCFILWCLWLPGEAKWLSGIKGFFRSLIKDKNWQITLSRWGIIMLVVIGIVIFFRTYQLASVPGEMFSDQAEKLYDVTDVLDGRHSIFFPRNTGREADQMYLTAAIVSLLGTGLTFTSLKIGTVLAGLLTLPFIYKLGKELGNRWVGLFAFLLAGIAYWPNVISRVGLRFPLYPLFVAPMLYYMIRGLRRSNRNDFIWSGIALGIGLHGYSPMRIAPVLVVIGFIIYLLHKSSTGKRWQSLMGLGIIALVSLVIFLPLLNYIVAYPDMFNYRALTRLSNTERSIPGPIWQVFLSNWKNASLMFFWNNGNTWVHSIIYRPALDFVTAALYFIGVIYILVRYFKKYQWFDLFLLISIPVLMLPSILSLAFPEENPSLNRTAGALVPVFIVAAMGLEGILSSVAQARLTNGLGRKIAIGLGMILILMMGMQNYDLVFDQYKTQFNTNAWNTSQIGQVINGFVDSVGYEETAYVIPYPYWVDTRLVGINAGFPRRDYALQSSQIKTTLSEPRTKLFIFKPEDENTRTTLETLYPNGILSLYQSQIRGRDFYVFLAPGIK